MHGKPQVADLEALLTERGEWLLRTAILLTGSHEAGEDLLQGALERLCRNWAAIHGDPEGYLRRTMTHLATDRWRRNARWLIRQRQLRAAQAGPGTSSGSATHRVAATRWAWLDPHPISWPTSSRPGWTAGC